MSKRLEADHFRGPNDAAIVELTVKPLCWLLAGIDLAAMQSYPKRKIQKLDENSRVKALK
ncbi:hypothetical protein METHB2_900001 [Candidatus Methylobacter favarea]|uniref:Uncharacterized protein n=1 Tax=Candidatus Methylobacter favarea TaxID=2707345 RepID=A0A8S0WSP6_9GAMM|nr:hypothetical protein METHB2_900001 [Candidatus Methylobacter favarea]